MKKRYTILTFIIGHNYEKVHEICNKQDDVEYLMVTDDPELVSQTWTVVYDKSLNEFKTPFERCFSIRYNVFKYASTDICVTLDGSMHVKGSLDALIEKFDMDAYDIALMPHPLWANMLKEYTAWVQMRKYPIPHANNQLRKLQQFGYDVKSDIGLFQLCMTIKRRSQFTKKLDDFTMSLLHFISEDNDFERLDQTWFTYVMNKHFNDKKVMPLSEQVVRSYAIQWYWHNSNNPNMNIFYDIAKPDVKMMFGKPTECIYLK